ncbi:MAG: hypothetical protein IJ719_11060 [Clostridia bacterium]|nr:hypothetical protein [Clostridia bacterium]
MADHHELDRNPIPSDNDPVFVNEPWLADGSYSWIEDWSMEPEMQKDNIRVYVPLDINAEAIMRRLRSIINRYGEANEANESSFSYEVGLLINQIEIYDQAQLTGDGKQKAGENGSKHSAETVQLVKRFVDELVKIPDGCAELFPFETVDRLCEEYGVDCDRYWR